MTIIRELDDLYEHLQAAIELEHATIPPYLCALYSIKPGSNQAASDILRSVVVEEMLHMTLACNVLNAIGGRPNIDQGDFVPDYPAHLPGETDFVVDLRAFSVEAVETFLKIERPSRSHEPLSEERRQQRQAWKMLGKGDTYHSIGEFYRAIEEQLRVLSREYGDERLFAGDRSRQIRQFGSLEKRIEVFDLDTALRALEQIIDQGEGVVHSLYDEDGELAHFFRIQQLVLGRYYQSGDHPDAPSGASLQVEWEQVYPIVPNLKVAQIPPDSELYHRAVGFNRLYTQVLKQLHKAFNGQPELLKTAGRNMLQLKDEALALVQKPMIGLPGFYAGPTFEYAPEE